MRVDGLIKELMTRLGEFEWAAKSAQFMIFPSRYPKGLFRSATGTHSMVLDVYIDEIKADTMMLKSLTYEQAIFRAQNILKKISVLTSALASQKKRKPKLNKLDNVLKRAASCDKNTYQYLKDERSNRSHENIERMKKALKELKKSHRDLTLQKREQAGGEENQQIRLQSIAAEIRYLEGEIAKA